MGIILCRPVDTSYKCTANGPMVAVVKLTNSDRPHPVISIPLNQNKKVEWIWRFQVVMASSGSGFLSGTLHIAAYPYHIQFVNEGRWYKLTVHH